MAHTKRLRYGTPRRPGAACVWLIVMLAAVGSLSIVSGLSNQQSVAATRNIGSLDPPVRRQGQITGQQAANAPFLPYADPVSLSLPTIGVTSELITVGKAADGSMEVPQPPHFDKAAWYRYSPSPGQYGASVIIGHVDSYANSGGSVFFNLAKLKLLDAVNIKRADGTIATFEVRAIRDYGKDGLPADIIYTPVTDGAELRLITCSGNFDQQTQSYERNTVVFATLVTR